jgi:uncharacterized membrane protein
MILDEPSTRLWQYVDAAESNRNNAWIGPNMIAELISANAPMVLTEWQPAAYRDGYVTKAGHAILDFELSAATDWVLTAKVSEGSKPGQVSINGKTVPFSFAGRTLTVKTKAQGKVRVEITFKH